MRPPDHPRLPGLEPWLADLPAADRGELLKRAGVRQAAAGERLFSEGEPIGSEAAFFGLVSGRVKLCARAPGGGEEVLVSVLQPGRWFGEISLLDGSPRITDAVALEPCELLVIAAPDFARLLRRQAFALAMTRLLADRIRGLSAALLADALPSTRARLAARLAGLASQASPGEVSASTLPVSRDGLARTLGLTRQTLHKELKALADAGCLRLRYGRIEIGSLAALENAAAAG